MDTNSSPLHLEPFDVNGASGPGVDHFPFKGTGAPNVRFSM